MPQIIYFAPETAPQPELFAPQNLLETCQGLQEAIATAPADQADTAGHEASSMFGADVTYQGSKKLELHTHGAYALPDGLTLEESVYPVLYFSGLRVNGSLAGVSYMRIKEIRTLAWMIADPTVRHQESPPQDLSADHEEADQVMFLAGRRQRRPLYVPVGMIESVMIAA